MALDFDAYQIFAMWETGATYPQRFLEPPIDTELNLQIPYLRN